MISDKQTNKVFLYKGLMHYGTVLERILAKLSGWNIETQFLPQADSRKHIWARDYMPIQLEKDKFLLYRYTPDYLKGFDEVIIVDYTLPAETMLWLKQNSHLVWIDHHYSSIMQSKEMGYDDVDGLRCAPGELICGAELAWKYFVGGDIP